MSKKTRVGSGSPWEQQVGYCRAIRVGNRIEVAGTTAVENGEVVGIGDAHQQTITILKIIQNAVQELGGQVTDIVRLRIFVTNNSDIPAVMKATQEFGLRNIQPVATLLVVKSLIDPVLLVEIEADAMIEE